MDAKEVAIKVIQENQDEFRLDFPDWIEKNYHVYETFENRAMQVGNIRHHYSAYTIMEVIRHETMIAETGTEYKISNNFIPDCSRLFAKLNPDYEHLFTIQHAPTRLRNGRVGKET